MNDIILKSVSKSYGENKVLTDVNITFECGKFTSLMGPSGSGKTTVLRLIMGLEKPDSGEISGVPENVSAVFQENRIFPDFDAVSNIKGTCPEVPREEIEKHLLAVGIPVDRKKTGEYSGGMKRRVAIVRAMCRKGDLYILDEPFSGLDEERKTAVMEYVKTHTSGSTVIMVTHDEDEASYFGGNIINLE